MDNVIMELILAVREIKDILEAQGREISRLKRSFPGRAESSGEIEERLVKLALQGSGASGSSEKLEKKLGDLEEAVSKLSEDLSDKFAPQEVVEREFAEEHLNRLRKALAE